MVGPDRETDDRKDLLPKHCLRYARESNDELNACQIDVQVVFW